MIAIISHKRGFETDFIIQRLKQKHNDFIRIDLDDYPKNLGFDLVVNNTTSLGIDLHSRRYDSKEINVAWMQQTYQPDFPDVDPVYRSIAVNDTASFFEDIWRVVDWNWINSPASIKAAHKLRQLSLANLTDLSIPQTIVSSEPERVRNFYANRKAKLIFKSINSGVVDMGSEGYKASYTQELTPELLDQLDRFLLSPVIIQEMVPKLFEVRTFIFNGKTVSVKIDSQKVDGLELDWRLLPEEAQRVMSTYVLPKEIESRALMLMKKLQLNSGAIDWIVRPDGRHIFLEINTTGSWYWMEVATGQPITQMIVDELIKLDQRSWV